MEKQKIITLKKTKAEIFWDPAKAVKRLIDDYEKSIHFLRENFDKFLQNGYKGERYRAYYPEIFIEVKSFDQTKKTPFSSFGNKIFFYFLLFYISLFFFLKKKENR